MVAKPKLVKAGSTRSFPASQPASETETAPRRHYVLFEKGESKPLWETPHPEIKTVLDVFVYAAKRYGPRKCLGQRKLNGLVTEKKKIQKRVGGQVVEEEKSWSYFDLSPHHWHTYTEALHHISLIGSGLAMLGFEKGDKLLIFASTCRDWLESAHGTFWAGGGIVTAYDTLGTSGLSFSLRETSSRFLLTHPNLLPVVAQVQPECPDLKFVILTDAPLSNAPADPAAVTKLSDAGVRVLTLEELKVLGGGIKQEGGKMAGKPSLEKPVEVAPEDTACIMYTSGSTGNPKGVVIPHSMSVAGISSASFLMERNLVAGENVYLAYLPLAHILEFSSEHSSIYNGLSIGYGTPKTLTEASVRNCKSDIMEVRPTCMCGVPMIWDTIMKGIRDKVEAMSPTQKKIFWWAFNRKWWCLQHKMPTTFYDKLVFNKIKERVGGRLSWALSGGALLSPTTQKFLWVTICPVVQGYGLTESCAIATIQDPKHVTVGIAGEPMPSVEVKLVDVPEANYSVKNLPNPQGEVWVRGASVMPGYFQADHLTSEVMAEGGWFMTGDIGELLPDGTLTIIDRKKNLVKLAHGEYVALEKLESFYNLSKYVDKSILYADMLQNFVVGLVLPSEPALRRAAKERNILDPKADDITFEQLVAMPEIRKLVFDDWKAIAKSSGLKGSDVVGNLRLVGEEWTPQNGMLTVTNKVKRKEIARKYNDLIVEMYEEGRV